MRASSWGLLFMRVRHGGLGRILGVLGQTLEPCRAYYGGPGPGFTVGLGLGFADFGVGPQGHPLDFASLPRRFSGATTPIWALVKRRAEGEMLHAETETCSANSQALHCNFLCSECFSPG